jgi:hypothetical protein
MVAGLSIKLIVQLYFRNAAHLTSFQCLLALVCPVLITKMYEKNKIQFLVYLMQAQMILIVSALCDSLGLATLLQD